MAKSIKITAFASLTLLVASMPLLAAPTETPTPEAAKMIERATKAAEAGGTGPFNAQMYSDPTLPTHTIYRPRDLEAAMQGGRLPIVVWGNGACTNVGNRFRYFLTELASQGYMIVAVGPIGPDYMEWKVDLGALPANAPGLPPAKSTAAQLIDGLNWAIKENARAGSEYFGRLDTQAIAVMGQSCGGLQAIAASADPRVKTTVVLNSGTFAEGSPPLPGTGDAIKASLVRLHAPTLWLSGDETDIAHKNAGADYDAADHIPAYWLWHKGTGHAEHYRKENGGEFAAPVASWLRWRLKGMRNAAAAFKGNDCKYCKLDGWVIAGKGEIER